MTNTLKQIRQRMGWAEDQAVNFVETAGGSVPDGLPEDTSSLLYHVRKLKEEIKPHIEEDTSSGDDSTDEGTTDDGTVDEPATDVEPVISFDPDLYTETGELLAVPDPQDVFNCKGNEQDIRDDGSGGFIVLDKDVARPGGSQSMRYDYIDQGINRALHVGKCANISSTRELWARFEARWSANFLDIQDFPDDSSTFAHKLFFIRTIAPGEPNNWTTSDGKRVGRWSLNWPGGGFNTPPNAPLYVGSPAREGDGESPFGRIPCSLDEPYAIGTPDWMDEPEAWIGCEHFFDEEWHEVRIHVRHDPGLYEFWIDGQKVWEVDGFTIHPEVVMKGVLPGRNKDDGLESGTESLWWGEIESFVEDPGW